MLYWLVVMALFVTVQSKKQNRGGNNVTQQDKVWRSRKSDCQASTCSHLPFHESYNCVNECVSSKCYQSIYAANPLEDGEVDPFRDRDFVRCVRLEQKERNLAASVAQAAISESKRS
jgi:hypothetical protein